MTASQAAGEIEWVHCNRCLRSTQHELVLARSLREQDNIPQETMDDGGVIPGSCIDWETTYSVLQCRGCGEVTLRRRLVSDDVGADEITYYPPQVSRQDPRWLYDLPQQFRDLLKESYVALHAGSKRLATMGARSLMDLYMTEMVGDIGGFQEKMAALVERGLLSPHNRSILDAALETGHAVSHRGHVPKDRDVDLVFDIVENLLQTLILGTKTEELKRRTPRRNSGDNRGT